MGGETRGKRQEANGLVHSLALENESIRCSCLCPRMLCSCALVSRQPRVPTIAQVLTTSLLQRALVYPKAYRGVDLRQARAAAAFGGAGIDTCC